MLLHMCTINKVHVMYGSWDIRQDKQLFWAIFCLLTPLATQKIKILKKRKKTPWRYHHFTQVYQKSWSYAILFLRHGMWWLYFTASSPKFLKNEKSAWRYHHFTYVYQKFWSDDVWFLRYGARRMDRWMDGRKKWNIEVGVPPKKERNTSKNI